MVFDRVEGCTENIKEGRPDQFAASSKQHQQSTLLATPFQSLMPLESLKCKSILMIYAMISS